MNVEIKHKSNTNLSSVYNGLWVVAYSTGHGEFELAEDKVYSSYTNTLQGANRLLEPDRWFGDELFIIPLSLKEDGRVCIKKVDEVKIETDKGVYHYDR